MKESPLSLSRVRFGIASIIFGVIGWFASFSLLNEYIKTMKDPSYKAACDISLLVTCGPNMDSWQGSVFGFSNPIIGIAAFIFPIIMGVLALSKISLPKWWWVTYIVGLAGGFIFIGWLSFQSIFSLNVLCPWCMVVWTCMIPLFWLTVAQHVGQASKMDQGHRVDSWRAYLYSLRWILVLVSVLAIATTAQLRLDWLSTIF